MRNLIVYLKTIKNYLQTSKGKHDVNDYLSKKVIDTSGYKLNISRVKNDTIGEYKYTITYNKITKKGTIKVVDKTPPTFTLKPLNIELDSDYKVSVENVKKAIHAILLYMLEILKKDYRIQPKSLIKILVAMSYLFPIYLASSYISTFFDLHSLYISS